MIYSLNLNLPFCWNRVLPVLVNIYYSACENLFYFVRKVFIAIFLIFKKLPINKRIQLSVCDNFCMSVTYYSTNHTEALLGQVWLFKKKMF